MFPSGLMKGWESKAKLSGTAHKHEGEPADKPETGGLNDEDAFGEAPVSRGQTAKSRDKKRSNDVRLALQYPPCLS